MDKELEFTKKIVLLRKLVREGLITEHEYNKARQKLVTGKTEKAKDQVSSQKHKRRKRPDMIKPIPTKSTKQYEHKGRRTREGGLHGQHRGI